MLEEAVRLELNPESANSQPRPIRTGESKQWRGNLRDLVSYSWRGTYEKRESSSNPSWSASKSLLSSHLREIFELLAILRAFERLFD